MNKKKKIAIVIPKYGLLGGAELFASELTNHLSRNPDFEFHVFANRWEKSKKSASNITFHFIPIIRFPRFLITLSFACFVWRKLRKMEFDIVHSHDRIFHADLYTLHGIPHDTWCYRIRKKKHLSLFDRATAWLDRKSITDNPNSLFLPVSGMTRDIYCKEFQIEPDRIKVVHPGLDISAFQNEKQHLDRSKLRHEYGIEGDDVVFLFVSMNFELKGLDGILKAVSRIAVQNPSPRVKLLVAGKGNIPKYTQLAERLGIRENVIFSGSVSHDHLIKIYLSSDVFILLSDFDTFGMSVSEAMASSLPVIISKNVGAKDFVHDGVNGFIVESESATEEIVSRMTCLLDFETRRKMGEMGFDAIKSNTWDSIARQISDLYYSILDKKKDNHLS